ncbi:hypothetical protein V8F06_013570 [Rhypophila decipiens]
MESCFLDQAITTFEFAILDSAKSVGTAKCEENTRVSIARIDVAGRDMCVVQSTARDPQISYHVHVMAQEYPVHLCHPFVRLFQPPVFRNTTQVCTTQHVQSCHPVGSASSTLGSASSVSVWPLILTFDLSSRFSVSHEKWCVTYGFTLHVTLASYSINLPCRNLKTTPSDLTAPPGYKDQACEAQVAPSWLHCRSIVGCHCGGTGHWILSLRGEL